MNTSIKLCDYQIFYPHAAQQEFSLVALTEQKTIVVPATRRGPFKNDLAFRLILRPQGTLCR